MGGSESTASPPAGAVAIPSSASAPIPPELLSAAQHSLSASQANAARANFDPSAHESLKHGKYRVATPDAERYFYESQPANQKGGAAPEFKSNLAAGNEGHKATLAAQVIAEEVAKQGGKLTVINNDMTMDEIRKIITNTEGLHISKKKREELSKQWRFFLTSDPIQYGLDAGFVTGSLTAAWAIIRKRENRTPYRVTCYLAAGYAVGFATFPFAMIAWEEYNTRKIVKSEQEMMMRQRKEFLEKNASGDQQLPPTKI